MSWALLVAGAFLCLAFWARRLALARRVSRRLREEGEDPIDRAIQPEGRSPGALTRSLSQAGFRGRGARETFLASVIIAILLSVGVGLWLHGSPLMDRAIVGLRSFPGGFSQLLVPVMRIGAPLLIAVILAAAPWLIVRSARRRRVAEIELDLPVTLELVASLGEAGQGFDASVERVITAQDEPRALAEELALYRSEKLAGVSGVSALRRLAQRIDLPAMNMLVSALVQAELVGSSIASTLRSQADDLRHRRRLDAQARAQALPVKLMVPLVVCFLPPIFVVTLGPAFVGLTRVIDSITR